MNGKKVIEFLSELRDNNNRPWFEANKSWYTNVREEFLQLVEKLIQNLSQADPEIAMLDPKRCVYRIYRDVRFSKDKTPYKVDFGAELSRGGRKSIYAGYYVQITPDKSYVGGGLYQPDAERLSKVRQEIDYNGRELVDILSNKITANYYSQLWDGDRLKRPPKGYDENNEYIDFLKNKSFVAMHEMPASLIKKEGLESYLSEAMLALSPFINYLNTAITDEN